MNTQNNKRLALHDSGGLEGPDTIKFVRDFITARQKLPVKDQIHAIWYVISCDDLKRAVNETDEAFLAGQLIDTGEIPIFVVFTQYDELNAQVRRKYPNAPEEHINLETTKYFRDRIYTKALSVIKDKSKVTFSRVGIRDDGSEYLQPSDGGQHSSLLSYQC